MAAVPVAKLGALLVKTLAKPVAGAIKARAKDHPAFRGTCIAMAQTYHRLEIQMRRRLYGQVAVDAYIAPLNEQVAVDTAADFLGEGVVFSVAVGVLAFEYGRQSLKEAAKEARQAEEIRVLQERQLDIAERLQRLENRWSLRSKRNATAMGAEGPHDEARLPDGGHDARPAEEAMRTGAGGWLAWWKSSPRTSLALGDRPPEPGSADDTRPPAA